jgi:PadR family transcriptional regulator PadR
MATTNLPQGTLDRRLLKAIPMGGEHGHGLLLRSQRVSGEVLQVEQGALYPAPCRLESQGRIASEWGLSDNNRRAKHYSLTRAGRTRLSREVGHWQRLTAAMDAVLVAGRYQVPA